MRHAAHGQHGPGRERNPLGHPRQACRDPAAVAHREGAGDTERGPRRQGHHDLAGGAGDAQRQAPSREPATQQDAERLALVHDIEVVRVSPAQQRQSHGASLAAVAELRHRPRAVHPQP